MTSYVPDTSSQAPDLPSLAPWWPAGASLSPRPPPGRPPVSGHPRPSPTNSWPRTWPVGSRPPVQARLLSAGAGLPLAGASMPRSGPNCSRPALDCLWLEGSEGPKRGSTAPDRSCDAPNRSQTTSGQETLFHLGQYVSHSPIMVDICQSRVAYISAWPSPNPTLGFIHQEMGILVKLSIPTF